MAAAVGSRAVGAVEHCAVDRSSVGFTGSLLNSILCPTKFGEGSVKRLYGHANKALEVLAKQHEQ